MRALILLARQETGSYLKDPIDYFIFPGGKLLAERQKMFPTSRGQATGLHTPLRGGLTGGARSGRGERGDTRAAGSAHRCERRGRRRRRQSGEGRAVHRWPLRPWDNVRRVRFYAYKINECALEVRVCSRVV